MIPAIEKKEALEIYNETKAEYKFVAVIANAASGCWMLGHWEKALFIMGRACIDDITDADNLNNYAAFLISTGGEQAALPILLYLNHKYPKNSTIQNNIGQAWFGLGDLSNAKKYLDSTTKLYINHSMANTSLSQIYLSQGDSSRSIAFLKAAIKETYDPDKEAQLLNLGYTLKYADMPPFNYPMKKDPFGIIPLINAIPENSQSSIEDGETALEMQRYLNGVENFKQELNNENAVLDKKLYQRSIIISSDSTSRVAFLDPHNSPAYKHAARSLQLFIIENFAGRSPLLTQLLLPFPNLIQDIDLIPVEKIVEDCKKIWFDSVLMPIRILGITLVSSGTNDADINQLDCENYNAKINAYLAKRQEIYRNGVRMIKQEFINKSDQLNEWIMLKLYGTMDDPPTTEDDFAYALIGHTGYTIWRERSRNKDYDLLLDIMDEISEFKERYKSACESQTPDPNPGAKNLSHHKVRRVECEYIKRVLTPLRYDFVLKCNTITEKTNPKLAKRKTNVNKGSGQSSSRNQTGSRAPLFNRPNGPSELFYDLAEQENTNQNTGPLNAENKDLSQFSIEYDRWGNLIGINLQLNKDRTGLADPKSEETGVDSRWSWNAIASPEKGFLNKLLIK